MSLRVHLRHAARVRSRRIQRGGKTAGARQVQAGGGDERRRRSAEGGDERRRRRRDARKIKVAVEEVRALHILMPELLELDALCLRLLALERLTHLGLLKLDALLRRPARGFQTRLVDYFRIVSEAYLLQISVIGILLNLASYYRR